MEVATNVLSNNDVHDGTNLKFNDDYFKVMANKVEETTKLLSKLNHVYEIEDYVNRETGLYMLRGFGKEFVLIKLIEDSNYLFLYSIYLNFEESIEDINNIYAVNRGNKDFNFEVENNLAYIYLDGELHSQSYINVGEEVPFKFIISFPNGMTGRGSWNISGLFNVETKESQLK